MRVVKATEGKSFADAVVQWNLIFRASTRTIINWKIMNLILASNRHSLCNAAGCVHASRLKVANPKPIQVYKHFLSGQRPGGTVTRPAASPFGMRIDKNVFLYIFVC